MFILAVGMVIGYSLARLIPSRAERLSKAMTGKTTPKWAVCVYGFDFQTKAACAGLSVVLAKDEEEAEAWAMVDMSTRGGMLGMQAMARRVGEVPDSDVQQASSWRGEKVS